MIVRSKLWHYLRLAESPLAPEHLQAIKAFADSESLERWAIDSYLSQLLSWTMFDEFSAPTGVLAFNKVRDGVLSVWAVATDEGRRNFKEWSPFIAKQINDIFEHTGTHRIECYVLGGFVAAERTIRRFGFEYEGTQKASGANKEDALLFARLKP